ncbi:MAG: flagellar filament capping protein FliD [Lachnospiraceae bacterium]|nr:flagellar filament capping protein FliD [Lachnospiraceae bacterium]
MAMRLTGLMSGMDTESIIQELVAARQTKVDDAKKAQTKQQWTTDAWKSLNTKLKNLQSKYLGSMRFSDAYTKKVTKVSNSNAVSVITGEKAVNGVQSLEIRQLAKSGYLTGSEISAADGSKLTAMSKLSDLGVTGEGSFAVKTGGTTVNIQVNGDTTISDVLTQLKSAGLNASFDENHQRFFVSAKESGKDGDFSLTATNAGGLSALSALGLQVGLDADAATKAEYDAYAKYYTDGAGDKDQTLALMAGLINTEVQSRTDSYLTQYKSLVETRTAAQKKIEELSEKYQDDPLRSVEEYTADIEAKNAEIAETEELLKQDALTEDDKKAIEEKLTTLKEELSGLTARKTDAESLQTQQETITKAEADMAKVEAYVNITSAADADGNVTYSAEATDLLKGEVDDHYYSKAEFANQIISDPSLAAGNATKVNGQDAEIYLNGAKFTNKNNTFEINGLTITALNETAAGEAITLTTEQDTDGIYDMVKNFLKEYNSIINEMDKLYNADSAKGYEPLTSDEKDAMSETEIEEYEKKIKDALLRRDDNLNTISSALKSIMSSGIEVNGKTMYLFDFGIETLGYFEAADNERNAYHIAGDPDDESTSNDADKLKSMISNDPDTVVSFFSKLSQNLYSKMSDLSKSVDGYRSFGNFYDDKKMKSDYDDYTTKIKELEEKLNDYEDKWYAKFSAMETALAKMQSSANAVTSLLGG